MVPLFILSIKNKMKREDQALSISSMKDKMERTRTAHPPFILSKTRWKGTTPLYLVYERQDKKGTPLFILSMKDKTKRDDPTLSILSLTLSISSMKDKMERAR